MALEKKIFNIFMQSKSGLIPEDSLEKLFPSQDAYQNAIKQIGIKLNDLGIEIIRTTYEGKRFFILGIQAPAPPMSEELLGVLIFVAAYLKENNEIAPSQKFESLFKDIMSEIADLVSQGYLQKKDTNYLLHPRTKVLLKNIYKDIEFQKLL